MGKFAENLNLGKRVLPPYPGREHQSVSSPIYSVSFKNEGSSPLTNSCFHICNDSWLVRALIKASEML